MKIITKSILAAAILVTPITISQAYNVYANTQEVSSNSQFQKASNNLDVSQGWTVLDYSSNVEPNVDHVFKQGVDTTTNQKCVLLQVGNMGDATFTAQKVIPMQKGHTYNLDLVYAQYYDAPGMGYIDFNGEKIASNDDSTDHHYKKTITPTENLNYTITVSLTTDYPNNAYFKIGYDKNSSGIVDSTVGGDVTAKYVDTEGNKIADDVVKSGKIGENYKTTKADIAGYTFSNVVGAESGEFTENPQTVTYTYKKDAAKGAPVTVKYEDESGKEIAKSVTLTGNVGVSYKVEKSNIAGYTFSKVTGAESGNFTNTPQTVIYTYKKDNNSGTTTKTQVIYRLYNPNTGEHFYPTSKYERDQVIKAGWRNEGILETAPTSGKEMYRVYNPNAKGGDHYYTISKYEATSLVSKGWKWDNNGKHVFYSGGSKPVYVAYNPNAETGAHNYTMSSFENNSLLKIGWKYGATAWYAVK